MRLEIIQILRDQATLITDVKSKRLFSFPTEWLRNDEWNLQTPASSVSRQRKDISFNFRTPRSAVAQWSMKSRSFQMFPNAQWTQANGLHFGVGRPLIFTYRRFHSNTAAAVPSSSHKWMTLFIQTDELHLNAQPPVRWCPHQRNNKIKFHQNWGKEMNSFEIIQISFVKWFQYFLLERHRLAMTLVSNCKQIFSISCDVGTKHFYVERFVRGACQCPSASTISDVNNA